MRIETGTGCKVLLSMNRWRWSKFKIKEKKKKSLKPVNLHSWGRAIMPSIHVLRKDNCRQFCSLPSFNFRYILQ